MRTLRTYRQTGMGRSFHRVNASDRTESFTTHNTLYNRASDLEFRVAIAQDDEDGEVHLRLGTLLSHDGRTAEAQTHYEKAAHSSDPRVPQAALDALR
jgi:Tfp pilus assembly protein PilF